MVHISSATSSRNLKLQNLVKFDALDHSALVQSFGKVLKVFRNIFCDSVDFISIILQYGVAWVYWNFIEYCYESRCARITNGSRIKTKIEIILQGNG